MAIIKAKTAFNPSKINIFLTDKKCLFMILKNSFKAFKEYITKANPATTS